MHVLGALEQAWSQASKWPKPESNTAASETARNTTWRPSGDTSSDGRAPKPIPDIDVFGGAGIENRIGLTTGGRSLQWMIASGTMVLPRAWKDRLGELDPVATVDFETATQEVAQGEVCGPVRIQLEGFRPIYSEVLFVEMSPEDGISEPLIGYIVLEQSQAAVDLLGHRLVHVKHLDLKKAFALLARAKKF